MSLLRELFFTSLTEDGNLLASSRMFLGLFGFLNPALGFFLCSMFPHKTEFIFYCACLLLFSARLNVNSTRLWSLFVCMRCIGWYHRCPVYSCWMEMLFDTVSTHFGILVILFYFFSIPWFLCDKCYMYYAWAIPCIFYHVDTDSSLEAQWEELRLNQLTDPHWEHYSP